MELKNLFTPQAQKLGSQLGGIARKVAQPLVAPIQDTVSQFKEKVQPAVQGIQDTVNTGFIEPIMKPIKRNEKIGKVNKFLADKGITVDDIKNLAEADGSDPEEALKFFRDNGIKIGGMEELQAKEQAKVAEEAKQGEDLGFFGGAKELATGAFRAGEQIPRIAGAGLDFVTQNVTGPLISGGLDLVGADELAGKWREGAKKFGEGAKAVGEDITRAGEGDITEKQRNMRRLGGELALTAPIGGGYLSGSKGVGGLALRSGVVGAGFGAAQPIIDKGGEATMGDIATSGAIGGLTSAVAGPLIGKVIAPAIGGIASKTGKYGQALVKGGAEGLKKSVMEDISTIPKGVRKSMQNKAATLSTKANRFNALDEADFKVKTGQTPGEFATSRGMTKVGEDAVKEASTLYKASMDKADEAIGMIEGKFSTKGSQDDILGDLLKGNVAKIEAQPRNPDAKRVIELFQKYNSGEGLTMSEINEAKRVYARNHKFTWDEKASDAAVNSTFLQNDLRRWQMNVAEENGLTNLADINKNTQGWKAFADSLEKKLDRSGANNTVSLSDWVALSGGNPTNLALFTGKKLLELPGVKSGIIKKLSNPTKPSIIEGSKGSILKSNFQKNVNPTGISSGMRASGGESMVRPVGLLPAGSKDSVRAQEESIARGIRKKQSTEQAKGIIAKEKAAKEALKTPDITSKSIIKRPLVAPKVVPKGVPKKVTHTTNAKQQVSKPISSDTIPEGYFKNAFGEIVKNPSNKKGAFIRLPEIGKKELSPLVEEARKYKSAEEFYDKHMSKDLMDLSDPERQRFGRLLEDGVDEDTGMYMNAKYTADRYGSRGNNEYKYQRGSNVPDVKSENDIVTIYRSTSKKQKEMLPGDFVSFSKDYAEMHNTDGHTLMLKVPAKDVVFQGNDFNEWIYSPESMRGKKYNGGLKKIWEQAHKGIPKKK